MKRIEYEIIPKGDLLNASRLLYRFGFITKEAHHENIKRINN